MITKNQFGVIYLLTIFTCLWGIYLFLIKNSNPNSKYKFGECLFNYIHPLPIINRNREIDYEKCLDGWTLNHFLIYLITGIFFPHEYILILFLSICCEIMEILGRSRGRLSDIIINLSGYIIGSFLYQYFPITLEVENDVMCMILPSILLSLLVFIKIGRKRRKELNKIKLPTWKE